jgi:hypothetical protein
MVSYDSEHSHIVKVKTHEDKGNEVGTSYNETRTEVISNLKKGKTYGTTVVGENKKWKKGETVKIIKIREKEYIRTDRNETEKDNLGNLPEF